MEGERADLDGILAERGESGARIVDVDERTIDLLVFELRGQCFAFAGSSIREVLPKTEPYFVPGCPPSLEGVINVRGDIESVIDISETLGLEPAPPGKDWSILMGVAESMRSGIRVDRVLDIAAVPESAILSPPSNLPEKLRDKAIGVFARGAAPIPLLDLGRIFAEYAAGLG